MDHGRFEELKDAYVLGALPEEERRQFEEYLAAHPERQIEIEELGAVAGLLALSPQEQEPPPKDHGHGGSGSDTSSRQPPVLARWDKGALERP